MRVSRGLALAIAAGAAAVVALGVYLGLVIQDRHQGDNGRRLAAVDHENKPGQVRQYRAELARRAAACGVDEMELAAAVVVAQKSRPSATAWGLLTSAEPDQLSCTTQLLYIGMGTGTAPQTLPVG